MVLFSFPFKFAVDYGEHRRSQTHAKKRREIAGRENIFFRGDDSWRERFPFM